MFCPLATSQRRATWPVEAEASDLLSGDHATASTPKLWPEKTARWSYGGVTSHRQIVRSNEPDASLRPSGDHATAKQPRTVCARMIPAAPHWRGMAGRAGDAGATLDTPRASAPLVGAPDWLAWLAWPISITRNS